jgi:para-aminobenzoate synthetase component 1
MDVRAHCLRPWLFISKFKPRKRQQAFFSAILFLSTPNRSFYTGAQLHIECSNADEIYEEIKNSAEQIDTGFLNIPIQQKLTKQDYLKKIRALQAHIQRGDCYEINFCQEFFAEDVVIHPVAVFHALNVISPNPFAALYKIDDRFLICASPERFLNKNGNKLLSQPMKGTAKRVPGNEIADQQAFDDLGHSAKDRAENVMVVDMVRNDLSVICKEGTVQAEELFEVHSFPTVHQMVSAITGLLEDNVPFSAIIRLHFPWVR